MQIWIRTQNNADHEPDPQQRAEKTFVLPVRLYEGVGHEPARHGLGSLPLDGEEYIPLYLCASMKVSAMSPPAMALNPSRLMGRNIPLTATWSPGMQARVVSPRQ
jgi:hypothetical protein